MNEKEILHRLRLLISLFYEEDRELAIAMKKVILGKPHQNKTCDLPSLFSFLETVIADMFLNLESYEREIRENEQDYEELSGRFNALSQENVRLKKQLAKPKE
jgi:hypothetical protein